MDKFNVLDLLRAQALTNTNGAFSLLWRACCVFSYESPGAMCKRSLGLGKGSSMRVRASVELSVGVGQDWDGLQVLYTSLFDDVDQYICGYVICCARTVC